MKLNIAKALKDNTRYIDVIPMNIIIPKGECAFDNDSIHNDEMPHGTAPDFFDILVRGENLNEDSLYCELEYIPVDRAFEVESMLQEIYGIASKSAGRRLAI